MFAFIIRNQQSPVPGALISYQVTVDSVQRVSGLDFFDVLPDKEETALKRQIDGQWLSEAVEIGGR
jgi:DNA/RNA endonuclease G (NUC1)